MVVSTIIIVILSGWSLFFLCKELFGRETAYLSVLFFFSSHYLWGFTHLGYPNLQPLFVTLTGLFFFVHGIKSGKWLYFFGSGIMAGLGFYTYYSSRIVIFLLTVLILCRPRFFIRKKMCVVALFSGFLLLFLPFIANNQNTFIGKMFGRSIVTSTEIPGNRYTQFFQNILISISGFFNNEKTSHFISGPLIDPVTAVIASIGFILILFSLPDNLPILIWFILALIITGGFSQYTYLPVTRLHFLLPIISIMAGFALSKIRSIFNINRSKYTYIIIVVFIIIYSLNLFRFYIITPKKMDLTPEAVTIGALTTIPACKQKAFIIYKSYIPLLLPAISSYNLSTKVTYISDPSGINLENIFSEGNNICIINTIPEDNLYESFSNDLINRTNLSTTNYYSPGRNRYVRVFYNKDIY